MVGPVDAPRQYKSKGWWFYPMLAAVMVGLALLLSHFFPPPAVQDQTVQQSPVYHAADSVFVSIEGTDEVPICVINASKWSEVAGVDLAEGPGRISDESCALLLQVLQNDGWIG